MKKLCVIASVMVCASLAAPASAAEQTEDGAPASAAPSAESGNRGVITLPWTDIVGRRNRPQAAVAISRMSTGITLVSLKEMFLERIEQSLLSGPF